ncbi:MAG: hypothetical protein ACFE95_22455 [Candidatus Hodarchaeota archaeon]
MIDYKSERLKFLSLQGKVRRLLDHHQIFKPFRIEKNVVLKGEHGRKSYFDYLLVSKIDNEQHYTFGIIIKDWQRYCDYRFIFTIEKLLKETVGLSNIILISNNFSEPAQLWAKKLNILIMTSGEIVTILNSDAKNLDTVKPSILKGLSGDTQYILKSEKKVPQDIKKLFSKKEN